MKVLDLRTRTKKNEKAELAGKTKQSTGRKTKGVIMPEKLALANKLLSGITIPEGPASK